MRRAFHIPHGNLRTVRGQREDGKKGVKFHTANQPKSTAPRQPNEVPPRFRFSSRSLHRIIRPMFDTHFPRPDALAGGRLQIVLATVVLNIAAVALLTLAPWSDWRTGLALNLADNLLLLAFMFRHGDAMLARLLLFGLAVGIAELPADAWLVEVTRTLDYTPGGGPMLWRSPAWMPLAWQVLTVQFACIGLFLMDRFGAGGLLAIALLGAVNIPYYEEMARAIHWWRYRDCRMIFHTPWYIILGETLIAILLACLARWVRRGTWATALPVGLAGGIGIFLAYAVAFGLTDVLFQS